MESFRHPPALALNAVIEHFLDFFPSLKNLYIVYEEGVNPYSTGRIRLFDMERTCHVSCEDKGCIKLASVTANRQDAINKLRDCEAILARRVNVRFVGAWRGGSRCGFGHALDDYEDEPDDEFHNPADEPWDGFESDMTDSEPEFDDWDDEELLFPDHVLFSDHEGIVFPQEGSLASRQHTLLSTLFEQCTDKPCRLAKSGLRSRKRRHGAPRGQCQL